MNVVNWHAPPPKPLTPPQWRALQHVHLDRNPYAVRYMRVETLLALRRLGLVYVHRGWWRPWRMTKAGRALVNSQ